MTRRKPKSIESWSANWFPLIDFGQQLVSQANQAGHEVVLERSSLDYFIRRKEWEDSLPTHAKRLWPESWKRTEAGDVYAFQLLMRMPRRQQPNRVPQATFPESVSYLLEQLQTHCQLARFSTGPDPNTSLALRISHGTVVARAIQDDAEYVLFEMRWYP